MTDTTPQAPSPSAPVGAAHLVLYDGVCGLCNRVLQFLLRHDRRGVFYFASLQSERGKEIVARSGGDPDALSSFYVVANYRTPGAKTLIRSRGALFVAGELGWPWKLMRVAGILPTSLLDRLYDLVARHRYRMFGRYEQCLLPTPEFRKRFVE